jgi:hypothetical protein
LLAGANHCGYIRVDQVVRPRPDIVARRVENELVLVDLDTNRIYSLNATGARLWELLNEGRTRAQIVTALSEEFDVGDAAVGDEVDRLLESLASESLVTADADR